MRAGRSSRSIAETVGGTIYLLCQSRALVRDVAGLILESGMRCGEVYRLKGQDVFLEKASLKVTKGKTKSSLRQVTLSEKAIEILSARLARFDGDYLFPQNDKDGQTETSSLDHQSREVVRLLGFDFRLYDCRHTFATRAIENGVDLITLSRILGHVNSDMLNRYVHPSEEMKAEAIRKMSLLKVA